jgi:ketosteroid isomerase-like protein
VADTEANKRAVERMWRAFNERAFERGGEELHDDFVAEWPHSGERIRGRDNFVRVNAEHPDPWISIDIIKIVGEGDVVASEVAVPVQGGPTAYAASFFELRDGKIARLVEYWVDAGEQKPYESRSALVERLDSGDVRP